MFMKLARMIFAASLTLIFVGAIGLMLLSYASHAAARSQSLVSPDRSIASATQTITVVYSQPPSGTYFRQSSQVGYDPFGTDYDQYVWDDFTLSATRAITEITWRGEYLYNAIGPYGPFPITDFVVSLYTSTAGGLQPDVINPPLAQYVAGDTAHEDPPWTTGQPVPTFHDYRFTLPTPFTAEANIKYWLQIEGIQPGPADWGLSAGQTALA